MLVDQVQRREIELCPNRLKLREAIIKVDVDKFDFDKHEHEQLLNEIQPTLMGVDNKTYKEFSQIYLPLILFCITENQRFHSQFEILPLPAQLKKTPFVFLEPKR